MGIKILQEKKLQYSNSLDSKVVKNCKKYIETIGSAGYLASDKNESYHSRVCANYLLDLSMFMHDPLFLEKDSFDNIFHCTLSYLHRYKFSSPDFRRFVPEFLEL